jgi:HD-GYP domain-containing protein (c-di-GMP phosphodiesterase class II)
VQTIIMLDKLPYPKHLKAVPDIAGGHHEKMDGTGYPRQLQRDDMSLTARMMAIADIFEALTASDRPYKKAKTVGEALKIMSLMRQDRHIDPELFELFLTAGVYKWYAERFLSPGQLDGVDISQYL